VRDTTGTRHTLVLVCDDEILDFWFFFVFFLFGSVVKQVNEQFGVVEVGFFLIGNVVCMRQMREKHISLCWLEVRRYNTGGKALSRTLKKRRV